MVMDDRFSYRQDIAFFEAGIIDLYGVIYPEADAAKDSVSRLVRTKAICGEVIICNETLAGFILWSQIQDDCADIIELCIAPSYQRQGLAASLLDSLKYQAISQNIGRITLEVRQTNLPACALYEKAGFKVVHRRTGYYQQQGQPVDALLMECRLTG